MLIQYHMAIILMFLSQIIMFENLKAVYHHQTGTQSHSRKKCKDTHIYYLFICIYIIYFFMYKTVSQFICYVAVIVCHVLQIWWVPTDPRMDLLLWKIPL